VVKKKELLLATLHCFAATSPPPIISDGFLLCPRPVGFVDLSIRWFGIPLLIPSYYVFRGSTLKA
jgi:hypothetical protein